MIGFTIMKASAVTNGDVLVFVVLVLVLVLVDVVVFFLSFPAFVCFSPQKYPQNIQIFTKTNLFFGEFFFGNVFQLF